MVKPQIACRQRQRQPRERRRTVASTEPSIGRDMSRPYGPGGQSNIDGIAKPNPVANGNVNRGNRVEPSRRSNHRSDATCRVPTGRWPIHHRLRFNPRIGRRARTIAGTRRRFRPNNAVLRGARELSVRFSRRFLQQERNLCGDGRRTSRLRYQCGKRRRTRVRQLFEDDECREVTT
jgi:hypothetical protein